MRSPIRTNYNAGKMMTNILIAVVWLFIAATGAQADNADQRMKESANYINMGSSYAAGLAITPAKSLSIPRCGQSEANYASLLANKLNLKLDDRSCEGAYSIHLLKSWNELPPQIDAVTSDTKLVTITVGGNDLSYVEDLLAIVCSESEIAHFEGRKSPCFQETLVSEDVYMQLKNNLIEITQQIFKRAPKAQVIYIQYVTLIPNELCKTTPLAKVEAGRMRLLAKRLATITAAAAEETNAMLLHTDTLSAKHTSCDAEPWSTGYFASNHTEGAPWHPNRLAHEIIAQELQKMLEL